MAIDSIRIDIQSARNGYDSLNYATPGASGFDIKACVDEDVIIPSQHTKLIPTGLALSMPQGMELQIRSRSGLAMRNMVVVLNSPGTIDSDYRGEIQVLLMNLSRGDFTVHNGDRIAQGVFAKVFRPTVEVTKFLDATLRQGGGFGSTGVS